MSDVYPLSPEQVIVMCWGRQDAFHLRGEMRPILTFRTQGVINVHKAGLHKVLVEWGLEPMTAPNVHRI